MNICIYGASSNIIDDIYFEKTEKLAEKLGRMGYGLVFGGGTNGLMGAAARGFKKADSEIIGVAPSFFNVDGVLYPECSELIYTETMRERKKIMEEKADAFIAVPGGIGTFDELFEILTLKQLGQHKKPVVIFNINNYYDSLDAFLQNAVDNRFMTKESKEMLPIFNTDDEIIDYLKNYDSGNYSFDLMKKVN